MEVMKNLSLGLVKTKWYKIRDMDNAEKILSLHSSDISDQHLAIQSQRGEERKSFTWT